MKKLLTLSIAALVLSSCATIFRKEFNQNITFDPNEPKEAYLYVDGEYKGTTPVTLELDSRKAYDIKYTKRGYLPNQFELKGKVLPKYVVGDVILGGVAMGWIPVLVDANTDKWRAFDQMDVDYSSSLVHWTKITEEDLDKYKGQLFEIENLYFETAKADIKTESYSKLDEVVTFMNKFPSVKFEVRGHTDSDGDDDFNHKLSHDRANSVVKYLTDKGIDASRLTAKGFGETMPVASNETNEGKARNRRVEFKLM